MKERILKLKNFNPTWGYKRIAQEIGCAHSTVRYHLSPVAKQQHNIRQKKSRQNLNGILKRKKDNFQCISGLRRFGSSSRRDREASLFSMDELKNKLTRNPVCYLTGRKIDLLNRKDYHLDHIKPVALGGKNNLENCGLTCRDANMAKGALDVSSFLSLCQEILEYNGYEVKLAESRELASQTV